MLANIINVESNKVPGKTWNQVDVSYKDSKGELKGKKIMSFSVKEGLPILLAAKAGDVLDVTVVQENNYWNWTKVAKADGSTSSAAGTVKTSGSSYSVPSRDFETSVERAAKQVYIVRQSSISAALNLYAMGKTVPAVSDVLAVAKQFEAYVFDKGEDSSFNYGANAEEQEVE